MRGGALDVVSSPPGAPRRSALAACPTPAPKRRSTRAARASLAAAADAGFTLTPQKLDAWLAYATFVLSFPPLGKGDGGLREEVQRRARLDERFRADAGLAEEDVDGIEELVGAVVAQRNISRITGAEALKELERATNELKDEPRAQAQKALRRDQSQERAGRRPDRGAGPLWG